MPPATAQWVEIVWNRRIHSIDNLFPMSSGVSEWVSEASSAERADERVAHSIINIPILRYPESLSVDALTQHFGLHEIDAYKFMDKSLSHAFPISACILFY